MSHGLARANGVDLAWESFGEPGATPLVLIMGLGAQMIGWDEVTKGAAALAALGQGSTSFTILTETGPVTVTALEWQAILAQATAIRQPIWHRSFALIAEIAAAADAAALAAIDTEDGWEGA